MQIQLRNTDPLRMYCKYLQTVTGLSSFSSQIFMNFCRSCIRMQTRAWRFGLNSIKKNPMKASLHYYEERELRLVSPTSGIMSKLPLK